LDEGSAYRRALIITGQGIKTHSELETTSLIGNTNFMDEFQNTDLHGY
jgi:hypothetical protein